jgi:hypothetical protein
VMVEVGVGEVPMADGCRQVVLRFADSLGQCRQEVCGLRTDFCGLRTDFCGHTADTADKLADTVRTPCGHCADSGHNFLCGWKVLGI